MTIKKYNFKRIHFYLPGYSTRSNGINILWNFAATLSMKIPVSFQTYRAGDSDFDYRHLKNFNHVLYDTFGDKSNTLVIYPDDIDSNPLNAKYIARFMLASPFTLNQDFNLPSFNDFIFCYSNLISNKMPQVNYLSNTKALSFPIRNVKKRNKVVIYYGKLRLANSFQSVYKIIKKFDEIFIMTRNSPSNQDDVFLHIAESKLFISLDPLTNLAYEANLLGTPSIFIDDLYNKEYKNYNYPIYGFYDLISINDEDFIKYNFNNLANESRKIYRQEMTKNKLKVDKFFLEMEEFFSLDYKEKEKKNAVYIRGFINFYNNQWKASPIFNCATLNSVFGFHILKISPRLFLVIFILRGFFINFIKIFNPRRYINPEVKKQYIFFNNSNKYNLTYMINSTKAPQILESKKQSYFICLFYKLLWFVTSKFK